MFAKVYTTVAASTQLIMVQCGELPSTTGTMELHQLTTLSNIFKAASTKITNTEAERESVINSPYNKQTKLAYDDKPTK